MIESITLRRGQDAANEAVQQLARFQSGDIQPIPTGIPHMDEALMGGLLPGTVLSIIGASFQGKTYEVEKIQRNIMDSDQAGDIIMMQGLWELETMKVITRDLSFRTGQSVRDVMFTKPSEEHRKQYQQAIDKFRSDNLYVQPEPVSAEQFEADIMWLIQEFPDKKIVVTIDNLENILVDNSSQKQCMDRILYMVNVLKKRHPFIAFVILNQMNSDFDKRSADLKQHKPLSSDIYQTKQLFKLSDVVLFKMMPQRFGITEKFMVFGTDSYPHLEEYKLPSTTNTTSFDPIGNIVYFYLKARESDVKYFKDIHIESMYSREDIGMKPAGQVVAAPKFDKKEVPRFDMTASPNLAGPPNPMSEGIMGAQGDGFETTPPPNFDKKSDGIIINTDTEDVPF